jgi:RecA-family ATPase
MNTGSGMSGSTGWSNSVRSRLFFEAAKASDNTELDPDVRTLTVKKANYARARVTITVRWQNGVYVPEAGIGSLDRMAKEKQADDTFLALLGLFTEQGQNVSPHQGPSYAAKMLAEHPKAKPNFTLILSKRLLLHEDFFVHWLQSVHWL